MAFTPTTFVEGAAPGISAAELNKFGTGIDDAHALNVDDVTVVDTSAPTGDTVAPKTLFNWFANMIKQITGKSNWRTAPRTTLENAVKLNGDTMAGSLGLQHFGGSGGFENGNADAASYTQYNFALKGWWGMGMKTYDNSINGYYDFRTGKWDVKDGYYVNGTKMAQTRVLGSGVTSRVQFLEGGVWREVGNLIDKTACIPFGKTGASINLTTSYQTVLSVSGKGFLDFASGLNGINSNGVTMRVTVDGVVKFEGTSNSMSDRLVLINRTQLMSAYGGSSMNVGYQNPDAPYTMVQLPGVPAWIVDYPYTANTSQAATGCLVPDSIYFNSSILIELKGLTGAVTGAKYSYSGGSV